jgi:hypothetical protein
MAGRDLRHAARREGTIFEVRELRDGGITVDLGVKAELRDLTDAVDYAFSYLDAHDPRREGAVEGLAIVRVEGGKRDTVWEYSWERAKRAEPDLVALWGFPVSRPWRDPYVPLRRSGVTR